MKLSTQISISLVINLTIICQFNNYADSHYIHTSKVSQCTRMIRVINQAVADTNTVTKSGTNGNIEILDKLVRVFDKAAKNLNLVKLGNRKLKIYRKQFLSMYQEGSRINKQLISSIKKQNSAKISENSQDLQNVFSPERKLTNELNLYCNK
ncbi:hypothetical protein [Chamaesiphon sp. VAR_48_metabat_403]|uniref:hypothetical protein n=1 Tax=Chamaesiphon sp. VAR_48_metabat_403 TaxID=2964700 RepID=UPI00286D9A77|nr:hypothetical protein [Chamaesiphon sp. VAR_48_metabat_403]